MPTTLIGVLVALIITFVSMASGGMDPVGIFFGDPMSVLLVLVATLGITVASSLQKDIGASVKNGLKSFTSSSTPNSSGEAAFLVELADVARRDGTLALDKRLEEIDDDFMRRGVQLVVDGTDPAEIRRMVELDIDKSAEAQSDAAAFWTAAGGYAPAMGVFGTVIGLIAMLQDLSDPSALGPSLAVAFVTTLWGVFLANMFFLPMSAKLSRQTAVEVAHQEMILEGILSIQAGANPRLLAEKLSTFLPPSQRLDPNKVHPKKVA